jgi:site-specific DNA-methyltransferase (adenine-specific)
MLEWLGAYDGPLFDACVTDPPYHLTSIVKRFSAEDAAPVKPGATGAYARASRGFMGKTWDGGDIAFRPETWEAVFRAMKPGAHLVAFSGTRTYHRMVCAIEDAGFEIRDQLAWAYGSGFPKSHDVSKALDKAAGAAREVVEVRERSAARPVVEDQSGGKAYRLNGDASITAPATDAAKQWQGWGTALKPAWEPIVLARKPLSEKSVAANVLKHGTGAINIDGCRVASGDENPSIARRKGSVAHLSTRPAKETEAEGKIANRQSPEAFRADRVGEALGRFPANFCHDGGEDVLATFPDAPGQQYAVKGTEPSSPFANVYGDMPNRAGSAEPRNDSGSAARFFYSAKAGPLDRIGSSHATVKPVDLMRWLSRLITPPGGLILDPFAGSGTTGIAAMAEGFGCTMLDIEAEHIADIERKLAYLRGEGAMSFVEHDRKRDEREHDAGPLFGTAAA